MDVYCSYCLYLLCHAVRNTFLVVVIDNNKCGFCLFHFLFLYHVEREALHLTSQLKMVYIKSTKSDYYYCNLVI